MQNKLTVAGVIVAIALSAVGLFTGDTNIVNPTEVREVVGASAGPDFSFRSFFKEDITEGGYYATSSSKATYTLTEAELRNKNVIKWTPNRDVTLSIGATSTYALIPNVGDSFTTYLRNGSSTAAATITLAALNTDVDLQFAEATGGDLVLAGLDWAKVTFIKNSNTLTDNSKVTVIFDEMTEAD